MASPGRIGRYEIVTALATGGMGEVYLAKIDGIGGFARHVVLKTLEVGEADDDSTAMFLDEARVLGVLHHHHIVPVYDIGRDDGRLYLVMEYVHGRTAHEVWQRTVDLGAALPIDFALTVCAGAAAGLHYAHTRRDPGDGNRMRIVHRDVTPSNLMIGFDGAVKLIDFGIAKAANRAVQTQAGFVKGKVGYMAPEQIRGQAVDGRTDVFALGIVLYELTTMKRAFREDSDRATIEKIKSGAFTPPSQLMPGYPVELERIVTRALKLDPRERYPDAETLRREIDALGHRLELVLGDAAIAEVMAQLFEDRREPWQRHSTGRAETELDVSLEVVSEDVTHPSHSPNRRAGTLHTATQSVDALLNQIETPARGMPIAPRAATSEIDSGAVIATVPRFDDKPEVATVPAMPTPVPRKPSPRNPTVAGLGPGKRPSRSRIPAQPGSAHWIAPRTGWYLAAVVGAAAIAVIVVTFLEGDATPTVLAMPVATTPIDAAAAPPPPPIDAPVAAPPDARTTVQLVVTSTPSDATVLLGDKKLGHTPFTGTLDASPNPQVLRLRKRGFGIARLEITLTDDVTQSFTLQKAPGP